MISNSGVIMSVPHGHGDRFVPEQLLDREQVHPVLREPRGRGVAQIVKVKIFDLCLF
jgi:hypothetical protein